MKKMTLVLALYLLPLIISAQSIDKKNSGIDDFTGTLIIRTSWASLDTK